MPFVQYRGMQLVVPENESEFLGFFEAAKQHKLMPVSYTHLTLPTIYSV